MIYMVNCTLSTQERCIESSNMPYPCLISIHSISVNTNDTNNQTITRTATRTKSSNRTNAISTITIPSNSRGWTTNHSRQHTIHNHWSATTAPITPSLVIANISDLWAHAVVYTIQCERTNDMMDSIPSTSLNPTGGIVVWTLAGV